MNRATANIFKALSDPNRIRIVKMLEVRELCVSEVQEILGLSMSTVSKHLSVLRNAELILITKHGKWNRCRLNVTSEANLVRAQLAVMRGSFREDAHVRDDRKRLPGVDRNSGQRYPSG